jgi:RNA polymerase sigma-70 factor (ECF subfamily)
MYRDEEYSLIRECLRGDSERYAVLVDRYKDMVYNTAYRMLGDNDAAHDMAQDSFISAYNALGSFKYGSKFSTWLYSIAMNKCRDHMKSMKSFVALDDVSEKIACNGPNPEESAHRKQEADALQSALNALPADFREAVVLKHIEGLDYKEMEEVLGVSVNVLKVRTHRARELLKKILSKAGALDGQRDNTQTSR